MPLKLIQKWPGLDGEAERQVRETVNDLINEVNRLGKGVRITELQNDNFVASEGQTVRVKGGKAGTLPRARPQNQGAQICVMVETAGGVTISAQNSTVNGLSAFVSGAIGLYVFESNGAGGWYCTEPGAGSGASAASRGASGTTGLPGATGATGAAGGDAPPGLDGQDGRDGEFVGLVTGASASADGPYVTYVTDPNLPNAAVATDTTEIDFTGSAGGIATWVLNIASVAFSKLADLTGLSVLGRAGNSTGVMAAITATAARQVLQVNSGGTSLQWGNPIQAQDSGVTINVSGFHTINGTDGSNTTFIGTDGGGGVANFRYDWTGFGVEINDVSHLATTFVLDFDSTTSIIPVFPAAVGNEANVAFERAAITGSVSAAQNVNATKFAGIKVNSVSAPSARTFLNYINSTSVTANGADNAGADGIDINFQRAALTGAISANLNSNATLFAGIQNTGVATTDRTNLNFIGFTIADNAGNDSIDITAPAGGGTTIFSLASATVDLGAIPIMSGSFQITGLAGLVPGTDVLVIQAVGPYTGKGTLADEAEDQISISGTVLSATVIQCYFESINGPISGNLKVLYAVSGAGSASVAVKNNGTSVLTTASTLNYADGLLTRAVAVNAGSGQADISYDVGASIIQSVVTTGLITLNATTEIISIDASITVQGITVPARTGRLILVRIIDGGFAEFEHFSTSVALTQRIACPLNVNANYTTRESFWITYNQNQWRIVDRHPAMNNIEQEVTATGAINNLARVNDARALLLSGAAPVISGIVPGIPGDLLFLRNEGGSATLLRDSVLSTAANRMRFAQNKNPKLTDDETAGFIYSASTAALINDRYQCFTHRPPFCNTDENLGGDSIVHDGDDWHNNPAPTGGLDLRYFLWENFACTEAIGSPTTSPASATNGTQFANTNLHWNLGSSLASGAILTYPPTASIATLADIPGAYNLATVSTINTTAALWRTRDVTVASQLSTDNCISGDALGGFDIWALIPVDTNVTAYLGFANQPLSVTSGSYIYFRYQSSSDTNWLAFSSNGVSGTNTAQLAGVINVVNYFKFSGRKQASGDWKMYINNTLLGTLSSGAVPTTGTLTPFISVKNVAAAVRNIRLGGFRIHGVEANMFT